jgi:hypothetical protein
MKSLLEFFSLIVLFCIIEVFLGGKPDFCDLFSLGILFFLAKILI